MQKKYFQNMKSLFKNSRFLFPIIILICTSVFGEERFYEPPGLPLSRDFLRLPDNRWIWLKKVDEHKTKVILGTKIKNSKGKLINKVIWAEEYEEKYDALWDYAYFLKIKDGKYFLDINHDNLLEVAIMPFDDGNWTIRKVFIFTVKSDRLELIQIQPNYPIETDKNIFK